MKNLLIILFLVPLSLTSQTQYNVGLNPTVNNGKLFVDIYVSFDMVDGLGSSNFRFDYGPSLTNPTFVSSNLDGNYVQRTVTETIANRVSYNIVLNLFATGVEVPADSDPFNGVNIGTISFDITDFNATPDLTWVLSGGTNTVVTTDGFTSLSGNNAANIDNLILPITLSSFTAEKSGDRNALLNWTSSQEINASHFTVQRSGDGYEFEDIGRIEAAGNSSSPIDYNYLDRNINIQRNTSKLIYYRLKQVDIDGFTEFSEIRALRFDRIGLADVSIYPNPTADILHLDISEDILDDQINYEIFDVQGKMVVNQQINIDHQKLHLLNLRASGLQSGIYFIKLRNQKELLSSHKFVLISQ